MSQTTLVWLRNDLRISDNPALLQAAERGSPVIPVFIWPTEDEDDWPTGAASCWWLHHSLASLQKELNALGSRLILRRGRAMEALQNLIVECNAGALYWNRRYEPPQVALGAEIKSEFRSQGIEVESYNGSLLYEPWNILTKEEKPYRVFTAFWKTCLSQPEPAPPLPAPAHVPAPEKWPFSLPLEELRLLPEIDWASEFSSEWRPGSSGAWEKLERFLDEALPDYGGERDRPDHEGTSRLSPHLHFGEISARQILHAVLAYVESDKQHRAAGGWSYLRQLGWREFSSYLLFHYPFTADQPLNTAFHQFPWKRDVKMMSAWQQGKTGYPLIDAGMRQLWRTGWMHNRVRMAVASFLVKDLMIPWQEGARWFWDTLLDANLGNNTMGWQWMAGCGADAAPFFRIFNPVTQGEKFDPNGDYIRRWVPELAALSSPWIHRPWEAPPLLLAEAGIELGNHYPEPVVDHAHARQRALEGFESIRTKGIHP